ncbi:MAG TPA: response regulator [Puia sp.]|nr:response regulator [Puia sp.]
MQKKLKSVLLIDDDEPTTFMYKMVIGESGCAANIQIAHGGEEALGLLHQTDQDSSPYPDLVFLDINMPRMDGWEFLEQLQAVKLNGGKYPVIVMLSTSLNPDDEIRARRINEVSAYRHKPLTVDMVREIVAEYFH